MCQPTQADEAVATTVVDTTALEGLRALRRPGQADPVARVVDLFIQETQGRLERLRSAVERGDRPEVHSLAHAQKGSSGTIGASEMSTIAREMELNADGARPKRRFTS